MELSTGYVEKKLCEEQMRVEKQKGEQQKGEKQKGEQQRVDQLWKKELREQELIEKDVIEFVARFLDQQQTTLSMEDREEKHLLANTRAIAIPMNPKNEA